MSALISPSAWVMHSALNLAEIDCVTAVMLKILDGKCKMNENESRIMTALYDATKDKKGAHLNNEYHAMIATARNSMPNCKSSLIEQIYEKRVLAETQISRPVMKAFKARLRSESVLPRKLRS
ncbi:MAG: hypothetical protein AAGJ37_06215 [Pseudomonadota bacterium]